jgi:carbonic anhydrase
VPYKKLIEGFKRFQEEYFHSAKKDSYRKLVEEGQKPETLVIACSDSRIDPAILTSSDPGEFFAVRNVAALVPPYNNKGGSLHGTSSAIEYAVRFLGVRHIVVLGHAGCGGVNALARGDYQATTNHGFQFLSHWLDIGQEAKEKTNNVLQGKTDSEKGRALEQATILVSMANLLSFPWIRDKCGRGELEIHGWYFDMGQGQLLEYNSDKDQFEGIEGAGHSAGCLIEKPDLVKFLKNYLKFCAHHAS